ncbi:MoaD/ThiS family protein [Nitrospira japonica]|nr:MoaD/ThiS family protein [Nitrospira japonica]
MQIRHTGLLDIQRRHGVGIIGGTTDGVNAATGKEHARDMVTIELLGQLQTVDGERDVAVELTAPVSVRQVIQRQGIQLRHLLQLIREKKVLVTINKKIASDDSLVHDGDAIRLVGHDGFGGSGLGPTHS